MNEPGREGRVLALIEAEFRADDPGLTELFDAFTRRTPALSAPRGCAAGQGHWKALAKRLLALLLVPLTAMTVLAALSGSRTAAVGGAAFAPIAHADRGLAGLERQTVGTVEMWAVGQGRAIRARICQSIPLPAGTACQ